MGDGGAMDDDHYGYDDNLAEANNAELGPEGAPLILPSLAEGVASSATDADEALEMCRDIRNAEELSDEQYDELVGMVESRTGWELPEEGERF